VELLEKILPLGKPILCEKPLVISHHQLNRVRRLEKTHKTPLLCGYELIYGGQMQAIAEMVKEKAFGKITRVRIRHATQAAYSLWFDNPELAWFYNPILSGGGGFYDMGSECVHLLCTVFGHAQKVWATIRNESGVYPETDDFGIGMIHFEGGVTATIEAGWTQPAGPQGLEIVGSQRVLWHDGEQYVMSKHGGNPSPVPSGKPQPARIDRLVALIRGEIAPAEVLRDLEVVHDCVLIMDSFYEANKQGRWLSLLKRE
jgi:predicted dehydrogenase